jgi:hypothetical protein
LGLNTHIVLTQKSRQMGPALDQCEDLGDLVTPVQIQISARGVRNATVSLNFN